MAIHLVRHANAGSRPDWHQPDDLRPLSNAGLVQASKIADSLASVGPTRILSSRYARCTQTVQPLADRLGLAVEVHTALAEEAAFSDTWTLVEALAADDGDTVACSHGNVISPILDRLHRRGIELVADEWTCHMGSVWTLRVDDGRIVQAVHTLTRP